MPPYSEQPYKANLSGENPSSSFGNEDLPASPRMVLLDSIYLPARQPRRWMIESVKRHSILTSLLVRPIKDSDNQYELIVGERRYLADQAAGLKQVPVTIRDVNDAKDLQLALIENSPW